MQNVPVLKDLVLLGGGHAHVEVVRSFGMQPMPGVRVTLVTKDVNTPYSGMLPGFVAGWYTFDECHVDLARLCTFARARLIHAEAIGICTKTQRVQLQGRPAVAYDALSVDIGITPSRAIPGSSSVATPVKPISRFVDRFHKVLDHCKTSAEPLVVCVVGGGAGGVELSLALNHRLEVERAAAGHAADRRCLVKLLSGGEILQGHTPAARRKFLRIMQDQGLELLEGAQVTGVEQGWLTTGDGQRIPFDECLWCTQASAAPWLADTGLQLDDKGFILINECLQAAAGPANIFACGDVATSVIYPRPKAGVFAVRAGLPLTVNLRRQFKGEELVPYVPQTTWLSLITTGTKHVVGTKGWLCLEGSWLWTVKDWIDRGWMRKYGDDLPFMSDGPAEAGAQRSRGMKPPDPAAMARMSQAVAAASGPQALAALSAAKMRCGGCGGKVGASVLSRALARLPEPLQHPSVLMGLGSPDDAAVMRPPPPGHVLVQTVDFFRSIVEDPFVFGAIAANHALGDCQAMGAKAETALAIAAVPHGLDAKVEEELFQMMAGATRVLQDAGCALTGGHTCEAEQLSLGFSVTGTAREDALMTKGGLQAGQVLVLTKPLGTGTIMAAAMRGKARGRWVTGALQSMQQSSQRAAEALQAAGATACTDVTGFGLLGHLTEMTRPSQVTAQLNVAAIPVLEGAAECIQAGALSSIHGQNAQASAAVQNSSEAVHNAKWPLLVDPQTGGGLLAGIPAKSAGLLVDILHAAGYLEAAVIGEVLPGPATGQDILLNF
eukprot:jgi/Astpho2/5153/Aster-06363